MEDVSLESQNTVTEGLPFERTRQEARVRGRPCHSQRRIQDTTVSTFSMQPLCHMFGLIVLDEIEKA